MDEVLTLADGRRLGWATFGVPSGRPLVALHGSPDSRIVWKLFDGAARRAGVRIIAPDRPGFGLSDPRPRRTALTWVDDQRALMRHLEIDRYPMVAISGGSPYATAAAWSDAESVSHLGLLSCIAPLGEPGVLEGTSREVGATFRVAHRAPFLLGPMARLIVRFATRNPAGFEQRLIRTRPPADRAVIERPEVLEVLRENIPNQFAHAPSIAREMRVAAHDWGFPLANIRVPTTIWQGGLDDVHPPAMGGWFERTIPGARLHFEPDFATFNWIDRAAEMFADLMESD